MPVSDATTNSRTTPLSVHIFSDKRPLLSPLAFRLILHHTRVCVTVNASHASNTDACVVIDVLMKQSIENPLTRLLPNDPSDPVSMCSFDAEVNVTAVSASPLIAPATPNVGVLTYVPSYAAVPS